MLLGEKERLEVERAEHTPQYIKGTVARDL
jgi:hypothetical protein